MPSFGCYVPIFLVPPTAVVTAAVRMRIGVVLVLRRCRTAARYRRRLRRRQSARVRAARLGGGATRLRQTVAAQRRRHIAQLHGGGRPAVTAETARPAALVVRAGLVAVAVARVLAPVLAMRAPGAARPFALVVGRAASLVPVPVCVCGGQSYGGGM